MGKPGTFLFRTLDDCEQIASYAKGCRNAVVIGGGLLGLEAARGLLTHGVEVTVIEALPQLMAAQLDPEVSGDVEDRRSSGWASASFWHIAHSQFSVKSASPAAIQRRLDPRNGHGRRQCRYPSDYGNCQGFGPRQSSAASSVTISCGPVIPTSLPSANASSIAG